MPQCQGISKSKNQCSRKTKDGESYCWQHILVITKPNPVKSTDKLISGGRVVGDTTLLDSNDTIRWEEEYERIMDKKYAKGHRRSKLHITGEEWPVDQEPPIFVIPRERGGPSYKLTPLRDIDKKPVNRNDVFYALISKGFPMNDVSSFSLGPIVGEGLCLVNAAFSKSICIMHIEGGGRLDLSRKNFWRKARNPHRVIQVLDHDHLLVDGVEYETKVWLRDNEELWLDEWEEWRRCVAMASMGDFHWGDTSPCIGYRHNGEYIDFVEWKKECYIRPSYQLLPDNPVFQQLIDVHTNYRRPLGLVHPEGMTGNAITPITRQFIEDLFNSEQMMCCQPYVIAGLLLGVEV